MELIATRSTIDCHIICDPFTINPLLSCCLTRIFTLLVKVFIMTIQVFGSSLLSNLDFVRSTLRKPFIALLTSRQKTSQTHKATYYHPCPHNYPQHFQSIPCSVIHPQINLNQNDINSSCIIYKYSMSSSRVKQFRELTPKITHTKTTITKSTPFLIKRHHLDDSEMKKALHYDETMRQGSSRTYSYQGERITCKNSKLNSKMVSPGQTNHATATNHFDYYNQQTSTCQVPSTHYEHPQAPYFKSKEYQDKTTQKQVKKMIDETVIKNNKEIQKMASRMRQNQEYGLQQMNKARTKMEKEAKKLKKLYKLKVEKDIYKIQNNQVLELEQQIKQLKIKSLQFEKDKLAQILSQSLQIVHKPLRSDSRQIGIYKHGRFILNKPPYQPQPNRGQDTDSSFSSFQFD